MLEINDLNITFNAGSINEVAALRHINLQIEDESFVCILGTNGSGKSTLLNAIAGSCHIDKGWIKLNGKNITYWPEYKRARKIGRVFQNPFSGTAPGMSICENLALAARRGKRQGLGWVWSAGLRKEMMNKVKELGMGLEDRLDSPIGKLSGGQRQVLTLLMATWQRPDILLLDEHTAALDPKTAGKVTGLTEKIITDNKLTAIMVTHSMQQAVNLGSRIIMMHQGEVKYDFRGEEKKRLKVHDLFALFDELRRKELIDQSVADLLVKTYV